MIAPVPSAIDVAANRAVLEFVRDLSTHSDVWEKLWGALEPLDDVEAFCPDPANYRYVVAYVGSRIFAFAVGMSNIYVRLDSADRSRALARGARFDDVPDGTWVYFQLWQGAGRGVEFSEFVERAYEYAKGGA